MGDEQRRHLRLLHERDKLVRETPREHGIERNKRLVKDEQIGFDREGPRQRDAARLAERQFAGEVAQMIADAKIVGDFHEVGLVRLRCGELQIVEHAAPGQQARLLKHHADLRLRRQRHTALEIAVKADDDAQQRRLAIARRTDKRVNLAGIERQREVAQHLAHLARRGAEGLALDEDFKLLWVASGRHDCSRGCTRKVSIASMIATKGSA